MEESTALRAAESLLGRPYIDGEFDCGHLVVAAQQEVFGRTVNLPLRHPRGRRGQASWIGRISETLVDQVEQPQTGDVALYTQTDADGGTHYHLGTVFVQLGARWILHVQLGGSSEIEPESQVLQGGLRLEGYYRWREVAGNE